jgi:hypothetical protein
MLECPLPFVSSDGTGKLLRLVVLDHLGVRDANDPRNEAPSVRLFAAARTDQRTGGHVRVEFLAPVVAAVLRHHYRACALRIHDKQNPTGPAASAIQPAVGPILRVKDQYGLPPFSKRLVVVNLIFIACHRSLLYFPHAHLSCKTSNWCIWSLQTAW